MKTYTYSEARQRLARLLDEARREGRVQIRRKDGSVFVLQPSGSDQSPLDVPGVRTVLESGDLVKLLREERSRAGMAILDSLADRRSQRSKRRRT